MHKKETWNSWSSWSSPVGQGIFYLTVALALAILVYTILNLAGTVAELTHPAPSYTNYPTQDTSGTVPVSDLNTGTGQ